jgi:hypothetical protein
VVVWWDEVWHSSVVLMFSKADLDDLLVLAAIRDAFWKLPASDTSRRKELSAEMRTRFWLSPADRR